MNKPQRRNVFLLEKLDPLAIAFAQKKIADLGFAVAFAADAPGARLIYTALHHGFVEGAFAALDAEDGKVRS